MGGIGGELVAGFAAVPKTSAQLRPGPGDVGAPGSPAEEEWMTLTRRTGAALSELVLSR